MHRTPLIPPEPVFTEDSKVRQVHTAIGIKITNMRGIYRVWHLIIIWVYHSYLIDVIDSTISSATC